MEGFALLNGLSRMPREAASSEKDPSLPGLKAERRFLNCLRRMPRAAASSQEQPPAQRQGFLSSSCWKVFSDALPLLQAGVGGYIYITIQLIFLCVNDGVVAISEELYREEIRGMEPD